MDLAFQRVTPFENQIHGGPNVCMVNLYDHFAKTKRVLIMGRKTRDEFKFISRRTLDIEVWKKAKFSQIYGLAGNTEFGSQAMGDHLLSEPENWTAAGANPDGGAIVVCVDYAETKNVPHTLIDSTNWGNTNFSNPHPFRYRFVHINGTFNLAGVAANRMPGGSDDTALCWVDGGAGGADMIIRGSFYTSGGQADHTTGNHVFKVDWGGMVGDTHAVWIYLDSDDNNMKIVYKDENQAAWSLLLTFSPVLE